MWPGSTQCAPRNRHPVGAAVEGTALVATIPASVAPEASAWATLAEAPWSVGAHERMWRSQRARAWCATSGPAVFVRRQQKPQRALTSEQAELTHDSMCESGQLLRKWLHQPT